MALSRRKRDYAALARLGVKTMIDLTDDDGEDDSEQRLAETAGMKFFKMAMNTRVVPTAGQIATFLSIVNDPANQPVYVHCVGGRHRTGVMTAIYRMLEDKWTPDQAFKEMKSSSSAPTSCTPSSRNSCSRSIRRCRRFDIAGATRGQVGARRFAYLISPSCRRNDISWTGQAWLDCPARSGRMPNPWPVFA